MPRNRGKGQQKVQSKGHAQGIILELGGAPKLSVSLANPMAAPAIRKANS
jgi:hypothetical protein